MKKWMIAGLAAGALACVATPTLADPLEGATTARRAYYQVVLSNAGPLFGMLRGKVDYDAKTAQKHADNLKVLTTLNNGHMWPKGSDNGNAALKGKTRALPAIWEAGSDVGKKGADFRNAVAELAAVAGQGKDAMVGKMKLVGASCSACHKAYRAKDF